MKRSSRTYFVLAVLMSLASLTMAGTIGYLEDFSLAKDRDAALKQLIPGTQDYYYFHCLHYLNTGQSEKVPPLQKLWSKRYGETSQFREIRHRQVLLSYKSDPKAALAYLKLNLGLSFNHQREELNKKLTLPTTLDQSKISFATLAKRAYRDSYHSVSGFTRASYPWLATQPLRETRRRDLLRRLVRPDLPGLVKLIAADLDYKDSRGFGSMSIHAKLTRAQLDELVKLKPELKLNSNFIYASLRQLAPNPDEDRRYNKAVIKAHLDRLWNYVSTLPSSWNSLKANVLYHRLVFDRSQGLYDRERFLRYIQLPRRDGLCNVELYKKISRTNSSSFVNLNSNYSSYCGLGSIRNDNALVRDYLMNLFRDETTWKQEKYTNYLRDTYLKPIFAETKILAGMGDMEQWYSWLSPSAYKALKARVDLDFAPWNPEVYGPDDKVKLELYVKNAKTLLVKVFEINELNYYRATGQQINTQIDLDGLVANYQKTYTYTDPALRRVKRTFELPQCKGRGIFVVEFIGNGKSSRAIIRKGKLNFLSRTSSAGQVFTVLDEQGDVVNDASIHLRGREYETDEDAQILIPYSTNPRNEQIIIQSGNFATLASFQHLGESYQLNAGIHVERGTLLKGETANVTLRPALRMHNRDVSLDLLEEVHLTIYSTDLYGITSTRKIKDIKLHHDKDTLCEFKVPNNLQSIMFELVATIQNKSNNVTANLSARKNYQLNRIDTSHITEDLHFSSTAGGYVVDLRGKTGEPRANRAVNVELVHRNFQRTLTVSLQTDKAGRVYLGALKDIKSIRASVSNVNHIWHLPKAGRTTINDMNAIAGEPVFVPYMGTATKINPNTISLLEVRNGQFVKDWTSALKLTKNFILAKGLPAGDYSLHQRDTETTTTIRVTAGKAKLGYAISPTRQLELRNSRPLQITAIGGNKDDLQIQLLGAGKMARIHVAAVRYSPAWSLAGDLAISQSGPLITTTQKDNSFYVAGRDIGDEYRYILDRKLGAIYPGNMLKRPALLLNPWAVRDTSTGQQTAAGGGAYSRKGGAGKTRGYMGTGGSRKPTSSSDASFTNLDFLAESSVLLSNLTPDKDGIVTIPRKSLHGHQDIRVVAIDPRNTVWRQVSLTETLPVIRDLRLQRPFDLKRHFTQQRKITPVAKGNTLTIDDIASSRFDVYDTLPRVYSLYSTLNNNAHLREFGFITTWADLKPERKRELYSKYACHELSFYLYKKDPKFFEAVIQPYLANKKDKTFLDHWLLGNDLSRYLKPLRYARLNIVERILLAQHIENEAVITARGVKDLNDLIPPNPARFNQLFQTALKGSALDTSGGRYAGGKPGERLVSFGISYDQYKEGDASGPSAPASRSGLRYADGATYRAEAKRVALAELYDEPKARLRGAPAALSPILAAADMPAPKPAKIPGNALRAIRVRGGAIATEELEGFAYKHGTNIGNWEDSLDGRLEKDADKRERVRHLYRTLGVTKEWAENNYYKLRIVAQNSSLVRVNGFWADYAAHTDGPFVSNHLAEATSTFTEMMFALAVLDLPQTAGKHTVKVDQGALNFTAATPAIAIHEEIKPAEVAAEKLPILVSQNFFRYGDRYTHKNNVKYDKYVTDEFLTGVVYGCHIVITNPTSTRQELAVLLQIPAGAIPVARCKETRSVRVNLDPYRTTTMEYYFYFPVTGQFPHYTTHIAKSEKHITAAPAVVLNVVNKLSKIDKSSWDYISQFGTGEAVIDYLKAHNLHRLNLAKIAWRMKDRAYYRRVIAILRTRHVYNHTLYSYAIYHNDAPTIREYLPYNGSFVSQCGWALESPLLTIDPVERMVYQHLEYLPLVNARAHRLGPDRKIVNETFFQQYNRMLKVLTYRNTLTSAETLAVAYALLLQDRVEEGLAWFDRVDPKALATTMQYDYFKLYTSFYRGDTKTARTLATKHKDHPVDKWRTVFVAALTQLDEIEGKTAKVVDKKDRDQQQTALADTAPSFEFKVEDRKITLDYQNVKAVTINYYKMDIELLFSRNPFVQSQSIAGSGFSYIKPNATGKVDLDPAKKTATLALPEEFANANVLIGISAGGIQRSRAYYANSMNIQMIENYGQVKVTDAKTSKPLTKTYVKVYALMNNGQIKFFKDGYTDLRGRFDYTSLNTTELGQVRKFALLISSDTHGAVIREATPPKR